MMREGALDSLAHWLDEARAGSPEATGRVLEACRWYLLAIANGELPAHVRQKVGASDVVQETFLEAQRDLNAFLGRSEEELLAWLRRILLNNAANVRRQYQTGKRDVAREVPLEQSGSTAGAAERLAAAISTPSSVVGRAEDAELLQAALNRLPEHMQQVIVLRHRENKSFAEIGEALGRSAAAARKLWVRGVEKLQRELQNG
jgi:RNA polymerase sigma-70 factor (ECF subfamily)